MKAIYIFFLALFLFSSNLQAKENLRSNQLQIFDTYNVILMSDQKVGTLEYSIYKLKTGYKVVEKTRIEMKRAGQTIKIRTELESFADLNWKPLSFTFKNITPQGTMLTKGQINSRNPKELLLTSINNRQQQQTKIQLKFNTTFASLLSASFKLQIQNKDLRNKLLAKKSTDYSVYLEDMGVLTTLNAQLSLLNKQQATKITTLLNIKKEKIIKIISRLKGIESTEYRDLDGHLLQSHTPALQAKSYPEAIYKNSILKQNLKTNPENKIDLMLKSTWPAPKLPHKLTKLIYRISSKEAYKFAVPEDDRQRIRYRNKDYIDVEVSGTVSKIITNDHLFQQNIDQFLEPSKYEAINDPRIKNLAMILTIGLQNHEEKVKVLNHFVHHYISNKTLDRSYAPALETLKNKSGDCTEHSVLLSALLRSQGIATKLVDGVVISGNILGYHEWVEVYIKDKGFIPVDPTFDEFPASVRRLKLAEGSTSPEGLMQLAIGAARILQPNLEIEVRAQ